MSIEEHLKSILLSKNFDHKINLAKQLDQAPKILHALEKQATMSLKEPSRPKDFIIVSPKHVPYRKNIQNPNNKIHFLHAIANIELLAIELPILALLRFGSQDSQFIENQFQIIREEAYHFELLKNRLQELGRNFGTLPVHHGLWDYAWRCTTMLEHQIMIPCYLEARGLDVCPEFIEKFRKISDVESEKIFQIILNDEIQHVNFGIEYLKQEAKKQNTSQENLFTQTLEHFLGEGLKSKIPLNIPIRQSAGFTPIMLESIS